MRLAALRGRRARARGTRLEPLDEAVERRRLRAGEQRQQPRGSASSALDDRGGDLVEIRPARDRLAVQRARASRPSDRQAVRARRHARRVVTAPVATAPRRRAISSAFSAALRAPSKATSAASPAWIESRRHDLGRASACSAACSAAISTFELLGRTIASSASSPRSRPGARRSTGSSSDRPRRRDAPTARRGSRRDAGSPRRRPPRRRLAGSRERDGHERETLLALLGLLVHVGDLDPLDRAGGSAERERGAGIVGVDVHLERGLVADDEQRVAELLELALEPVAVELLALDHEDGAVAVARGLQVDRLDARRRLGGRRGRHRLAGDRAGQSAQELDEPGAARVDDPASRRTSSCSGVRATASSPCRTRSTSSSPSGSDSTRAAPPPPRARG